MAPINLSEEGPEEVWWSDISCGELSESFSTSDFCESLSPTEFLPGAMVTDGLTHQLQTISPPASPMETPMEFTSFPSAYSRHSSGVPDSPSVSGSETDGSACFGCGETIRERYLLKVSERAWHVTCLSCCVCNTPLDRQASCYIRQDNIYCKQDYARQFGTKCAKCNRSIQSTDWVRRAKDNVYHLACFACDSCKRQLSTGEEFALQEDRVLCKTHYIESIEGGNSNDEESSGKQKAKRVRTTFTEEQIQVLQANFQLDSNPDGQDLERIAQITGLSKRVTQVWFQNSRARQKKHQQHQNKLSPYSSHASHASSCTTLTDSGIGGYIGGQQHPPSPTPSLLGGGGTTSPASSSLSSPTAVTLSLNNHHAQQHAINLCNDVNSLSAAMTSALCSSPSPDNVMSWHANLATVGEHFTFVS